MVLKNRLARRADSPAPRPPGPPAPGTDRAQVVRARAPARAQVVVVVRAPPVTYVLLYAADNPRCQA